MEEKEYLFSKNLSNLSSSQLKDLCNYKGGEPQARVLPLCHVEEVKVNYIRSDT
jgi:hypothetical protein